MSPSCSQDCVSAISVKRNLAARLICVIERSLWIRKLTGVLLFPTQVNCLIECSPRSPLGLLEPTQSIAGARVFSVLEIQICILGDLLRTREATRGPWPRATTN